MRDTARRGGGSGGGIGGGSGGGGADGWSASVPGAESSYGKYFPFGASVGLTRMERHALSLKWESMAFNSS